ncbi:MAG: phage scaffolding protein [Bacillota bacterium]|nr:phage scaffolding protein [Bacillota bacterium]
MKKEDFLTLGLDEKTAQKCADASAEELKGFIPKIRFDEVNESKKQLETLKNSAVDTEPLKKQITELETRIEAEKASFEAKVKQMKIDSIVERSLTAAKAKSTVAAKALLTDFLENAELEGDNIKGLDEEVKKLADSEDTRFLFGTERTTHGLRGVVPGEKKDGQPGTAKPASLTDAVKLHFQSNE